MKEAHFYIKLNGNKVKCELCPHNCIIADGNSGNCKVRKNEKGILLSVNYGKLSGYQLDPVEKKPLYHFYPGKSILSIGSFGCNLHCQFCQNFEISQNASNPGHTLELSPESIINDALRKKDNIGIAYTYNEPLVFYEFMRDTALLAKQHKLKNVMVSNGYISPAPLDKLLLLIDAFNIDLKAFTNDFYKNYTRSEIEEVKRCLIAIHKAGKHLEITNLVIPEINDDKQIFEAMVEWINNELGNDTVLHLSRYFPRYKMTTPPTSQRKLDELYRIAKESLDFVYIGNMTGTEGQNTYCPNCQILLIQRDGYDIELENLGLDGKCKKCQTKVIENI
jgi:pyruvate formate lyase activating enzyme